ncbi:DUF222 domain-containing protein [Propionicicella superfundia]|uniref:DUF222 domain-containing protein n=1 Tax=Propionicicella superfundia TaxID=348582 RepID=UPI0004178648|nr:DUF222 domain-containing protein [Propionicicella superfundia]
MFESVEAVAGDGVPAGLWCLSNEALSNEALLDELGAAGVELSRVQARWWGLLAEAERRGAAMEVHEVSTSGLLTSGNSHTARAARAEVRLATELRAVPEVARALASGGLSTDQARGIVQGLSVLPADVPDADRRAAAAHLVELAAEHGPDELRRLAHHVVAVLSPDTVEEADRAAVERADRLASRDRYLSWTRDGDHGLVVRGSLPAVAGEQLVEVLSAISARARAAVAVSGERLSRAQANADALGVLVEHALSCGVAPVHGADRPRVVVTVDHDVLVGRVAGTGLLVGSGVPLTAEQARLVACDAGVLPVVMGGGSVPLDVGRERRLFTGTQRAFLVVRDQGCVPGL